jgi:hypothetical protein
VRCALLDRYFNYVELGKGKNPFDDDDMSADGEGSRARRRTTRQPVHAAEPVTSHAHARARKVD